MPASGRAGMCLCQGVPGCVYARACLWQGVLVVRYVCIVCLAGSIRIPAAYCGVYGLKPSYDMVPYYIHGQESDTKARVRVTARVRVSARVRCRWRVGITL